MNLTGINKLDTFDSLWIDFKKQTRHHDDKNGDTDIAHRLNNKHLVPAIISNFVIDGCPIRRSPKDENCLPSQGRKKETPKTL